ncbi:response regulator [Stenotrophomonas rhizophila]|uniref:CheY-like chemotaxis protein n=1 Tax=Stenotrophomonas rhizophila TaxID=216778 RepID=A0AAP5E9E9_9GAMM|nr:MULTISPECIES: response regulator [Stenotrophomonas]HBZ47487.1 response regulator [Stenotrophomonas sp.]AOA72968.1 chemotaxis protein CheY [Stenotrophomonas rhizophila]MDQ1108077.1 CheY-like chemotaxis protein [Stenotrophomonas rhizophila]MDY0978922.1 response regulator [Stenotrophomonas sp. CFBP8994]PAK93954.1 response regulator [Stenotrophomonas rhizophila]
MSPRVLVVEDESLIAMLVEDGLETLGYEVVGPVGTVDAALRIVEQTPFDLALLDINLGGKQSFPIAEALESRGIPYVFLTGYDRSSLPLAFQHRFGLQKPFRMSALQQALEKLQGSKRGGNAPAHRPTLGQ